MLKLKFLLVKHCSVFLQLLVFIICRLGLRVELGIFPLPDVTKDLRIDNASVYNNQGEMKQCHQL